MQGDHFELSGHKDVPDCSELTDPSNLPSRAGLPHHAKPSNGVELPDHSELLDCRESLDSLEPPPCLELIPGLIHRDWVVNNIMVRLPWQTLYNVVSVHRTWRESITSGEVYRAKQYGQRTSTFLAILLEIPREEGDYQSIYIFDPKLETWTLLPSIPSIQEGVPLFATLCFAMGKLLVIGGQSDSLSADEQSKTTFMLDLGACRSTWVRKQDLLWPRKDFACHAFDNTVYLCGGRSPGTGKFIRATHAYHLEDDIWEPVADMLNFLSMHRLCRMGDRLVVTDGFVSADESVGKSKPVSDMEETEAYDPKTDTWTLTPNITIDPPLPFKETLSPVDGDVPLGMEEVLMYSLDSVRCGDRVGSLDYDVFAIDIEGEIYSWVYISETGKFLFVRIAVMDRKVKFYEVAPPVGIRDIYIPEAHGMLGINL